MEIKEWRWSGERAQWTEGRGAASAPADAVLRPDGREYQQMLGFGGCFNELGWRALSRLGEEERLPLRPLPPAYRRERLLLRLVQPGRSPRRL